MKVFFKTCTKDYKFNVESINEEAVRITDGFEQKKLVTSKPLERFNDNSEVSMFTKPLALAIGTFDGMHRGHISLLNKLFEVCRKDNCHSMVYTFKNHPISFLNPSETPPMLLSLKQKISEFQKTGLDYLIIQKFDSVFSKLTPQSFIDNLTDCYNIKHILTGHDFKFGSGGNGNIQMLSELSSSNRFSVTTVPPFKINGRIVSSSAIRTLIMQGKVREAKEFLGYPYTLIGKVEAGVGRGNKLGFPTANLQFDNKMAIPGFGVYLTKTIFEQKEYWGATSVGDNPTFDQAGTHIETHILNFNNNLYGKSLKLLFIDKLRDQVRFNSTEELVEQIRKDVSLIKFMICKV